MNLTEQQADHEFTIDISRVKNIGVIIVSNFYLFSKWTSYDTLYDSFVFSNPPLSFPKECTTTMIKTLL